MKNQKRDTILIIVVLIAVIVLLYILTLTGVRRARRKEFVQIYTENVNIVNTAPSPAPVSSQTPDYLVGPEVTPAPTEMIVPETVVVEEYSTVPVTTSIAAEEEIAPDEVIETSERSYLEEDGYSTTTISTSQLDDFTVVTPSEQ